MGVYGRITLESVRRLKGITRECRELVEKGKGHGMVEGGVVDGWRGQQLVLGGGDGDGSGDGRVEGIEDVSLLFFFLRGSLGFVGGGDWRCGCGFRGLGVGLVRAWKGTAGKK